MRTNDTIEAVLSHPRSVRLDYLKRRMPATSVFHPPTLSLSLSSFRLSLYLSLSLSLSLSFSLAATRRPRRRTARLAPGVLICWMILQVNSCNP
jgi:hypothetical protein